MQPPDALQLVGHELRWRLLRELAASDRTVRELTDLVGQPQNLVSYHLGKLRRGELVAARRSAADGRDAYYRALLDRIGLLLADTGAALHPSLRLVPAPPATPAPHAVLFLCTGNSARSPMAAALARHRSGGAVEAASAGSAPKPLHPEAVRTMRERFGIDLADHRPTRLADVADGRFDRVVTLCDRVKEVCPELPGRPAAAHWSMPEPTDPAAFDALADELESRVAHLLASLSPS